jgi:hypothetical protein
MQPMIWVASAKRLLGRSAGRRLRRKCNRIGSPARQALRSRTISASPTFSNASRRPFLSHQRAFWSQPNDSASPAAHDFSVARQPRLRRHPAQRRPSWLSGARRARGASAADGRMAPCSEIHLALSLFARLEAFNRRIPTPPQCQIDPLQHDVVDF